jgi:phospholipid-binding lipoprotein MlaA
VVRIYASPIGYINEIRLRNSLYGLNYLDTRAQLLSAEGVLEAAALDKYRYLRNAYLRARRYQVYDGKPPPEDEEE